MKLDPDVLAHAAQIQAGAAFILLPTPEGGTAAFCRACGARVELDREGFALASEMRHRVDCVVSRVLGPALAGKPVILAAAHKGH